MRTGQGAVAVLCGLEGNRRFGIAPAMPHRLCGMPYIHLQVQWPKEGK